MKVRVTGGNLNELVEGEDSGEDWRRMAAGAFRRAVDQHLARGIILNAGRATQFCEHPDKGPSSPAHRGDFFVSTRLLSPDGDLLMLPTPSPEDSARIRWLEKAYTVLRERFLPDAPDKVHIGVAYLEDSNIQRRPFSQASMTHQLACTYRLEDESPPIIAMDPSVARGEQLRALSTLLHEMVHLVQPRGTKFHGPAFAKIARRVGFLSPWRQTPASPALSGKLQDVIKILEG